MARIDAIREKIQKLGRKQKLDALIKYASDGDDMIRAEVAIAMGMISTYESGMALIPLLRDSSPMVRAAAATSAADINAKHCEEYVKKLAFADSDPNVRNVAKAAFDRLKTSVV
ncbi:MAG: HEAT repeat domain-containing protein [Clostridiales bacterium]|nr:HEAT repeat domain-containing protein [Clostridiales bacterium]